MGAYYVFTALQTSSPFLYQQLDLCITGPFRDGRRELMQDGSTDSQSGLPRTGEKKTLTQNCKIKNVPCE